MSGQDSRNDVESDMEWLAGLEQPTPEDDDASGEVESAANKDAMPDKSANAGIQSAWDDGLLELRRRAQDYKNRPPIHQNNPRTGLPSRLRRFWR